MKSVAKMSAILGGVVMAAWLTAGSAVAGNLVLVDDVQGEGVLYAAPAEAQPAQAKQVKHAKSDCLCLEDLLAEGMPQAAAPAVQQAKTQNLVAMAATGKGAGDVY